MKKHLLIGGNGFIGKHLQNEIVNKGDEVMVMDLNPHPKSHEWQAMFQQADVIYILAARMGWDAPWMDLSTNGRLIWQVMERIRDYGRSPRVVLASSQAVYGPGAVCRPSEQVFPQTPYGISKASQEQVFKDLCNVMGLTEWCILRYSIVVGPGQKYDGPYQGLLRSVMQAIIWDRRPILFNDGKNVRDFVSVYDVAHLTYRAGTEEIYGTHNIRGDEAASTYLVSQFMLDEAVCQGFSPKKALLVPEQRRGDLARVLSETSGLLPGNQPWGAIRDYVQEQLMGSELPDPGDAEEAVQKMHDRGELVAS